MTFVEKKLGNHPCSSFLMLCFWGPGLSHELGAVLRRGLSAEWDWVVVERGEDECVCVGGSGWAREMC